MFSTFIIILLVIFAIGMLKALWFTPVDPVISEVEELIASGDSIIDWESSFSYQAYKTVNS